MMQRAKDALDIGLVVGNIDASLKFYRDILGLEFIEKTQVRTGTGTTCRLRFGNSELKLTETPNKLPNATVGIAAQLGIRYITFLIKNLSGLCKELQDKAIPFEVPERESRPGVRLAMVRDPDGNIIEFVEVDPLVHKGFI
jgi:catechol 2,3-dioxygenase-like lactoylglutathione lyase family enzyme